MTALIPTNWRHVVRDFNPDTDCGRCWGSGWSNFVQGGGTVCAKCGGSGRRRTERQRVRLDDAPAPRQRVLL